MTECKAPQFEQEVRTLLVSLKDPLVKSDLTRVKLALQDLYHLYRWTNPCRQTLFSQPHRCVLAVYHDAYDKLYQLERNYTPPPQASKPHRPVMGEPAPAAAPNVKPVDKAIYVGEIDETTTDT